MHKNPRVGSNEYHANHQEVRKLRGRAAEHACVHCGEAAEHWATIRNVDASDPYSHYISLCVQCHWAYDDAERRANMSAAAKGKVIAPETRKKMRAAALGRVQSTEERRKKSEALTRYWTEWHSSREVQAPRDVSKDVPLSDCLTPAEAGELLRVSTRMLWRWANAGTIPFVRTHGGHRRYPKSEIQRLAEGGQP